jgi:hypothetical protein
MLAVAGQRVGQIQTRCRPYRIAGRVVVQHRRAGLRLDRLAQQAAGVVHVAPRRLQGASGVALFQLSIESEILKITMLANMYARAPDSLINPCGKQMLSE